MPVPPGEPKVYLHVATEAAKHTRTVVRIPAAFPCSPQL